MHEAGPAVILGRQRVCAFAIAIAPCCILVSPRVCVCIYIYIYSLGVCVYIYIYILPSIPALSFIGTNLLQDGVVKHCVSSDQGAYMFAQISMCRDPFYHRKYGHIPSHNNFGSIYFHNPSLLCFVQDRFQAQSIPRTAFRQ